MANPPFTIASSNSDANGYGSFEYAVPSGYYALCSKNLADNTEVNIMAYTTINNGKLQHIFNSALWTGDGNSTQAITNDGNSNLQPDFVWLKRRNGVENHTLADTSRGVTKRISSNETNAEDTNGIASVQSDGFTVSLSYNGNANGSTYVGWQWKANGGTTSTNSEMVVLLVVQYQAKYNKQDLLL